MRREWLIKPTLNPVFPHLVDNPPCSGSYWDGEEKPPPGTSDAQIPGTKQEDGRSDGHDEKREKDTDYGIDKLTCSHLTRLLRC